MKKFKLYTLAMLAGLFVLTGCEKDDDDTEQPPAGEEVTKNISLELVPTLNGLALESGAEIELNGQTINLDFFKMILSNVEVFDDSNEVLANNDGTAVIAGLGEAAVVIGSTEEEHFHMMRFDIGLDATANAQSAEMADYPLNDQQMVWGWAPGAGYKFVRLDGSVNGTSFASHAVGQQYYEEDVLVSLHDLGTDGDEIQIVLEVELSDMFDGLTFDPAVSNHGVSDFNTAYMAKLGTGSPFNVD